MELRSEWRLTAPVEAVWRILMRPEEWPNWWRYVAAVNKLRDGDSNGVGALYHCQWHSRLPYGLAFTLRTVKVTKPVYLEGEARGDVQGFGRWQLAPWKGGTQGPLPLARATWQTLDAPARPPTSAGLCLEPPRRYAGRGTEHGPTSRRSPDGLPRHKNNLSTPVQWFHGPVASHPGACQNSDAQPKLVRKQRAARNEHEQGPHQRTLS